MRYSTGCVINRFGTRLQLWQCHEAKQTTCVLIHGFGEGSYVWKDFAPQINGSRVIAFDLSGHGDSAWDFERRYGISRYLEDLRAVLRMVEGSVKLVGHSMGAEIALRVAAEEPRISELVMVDFGVGLNNEAREHARANFSEQFLRYGARDLYVDWLLTTRPVMTRATATHVADCALREDEAGAFVLKCDPALTYPENYNVTPDEVLTEHLRKIRCPTLVVRGGASAVFSSVGAALTASLVLKGTMATVRAAGHSVMLDNPSGFASCVLPFLGGGSPSRERPRSAQGGVR